MRLAGIRGVVRGRHSTTTTRRDASVPRHPDLVGRGWDVPEAVDELWVADFSYVWTLAGFVYVAFVVDVYSRRILGWRVSGSMRTQLVIDAFRQALHTRHRGDSRWTSEGLIHHSDAGSQGFAPKVRGGRAADHRQRAWGQARSDASVRGHLRSAEHPQVDPKCCGRHRGRRTPDLSVGARERPVSHCSSDSSGVEAQPRPCVDPL